MGNYNSDEHSVATVSEFRFLPAETQGEEFEGEVVKQWATYK